MKKEILELLEKIDGEVMAGLESYDEEEENKIWKALFQKRAREKGIDEQDIQEYIKKIFS